ncbi:MAG: hypothetical protein HPY45_16135 [Anaerolineae bacterium]|nr:hypothetical protein [Anaerolineae bacterium]
MSTKKIRPIYRSVALVLLVVFALQIMIGEVIFSHQAVAATLPSPVPTRTPTLAPSVTPTKRPTAGPTPTLYPTLSDFSVYPGNARLSLAQLGYTEIIMNYPDTEEVFVALPDQWQVRGSSFFTLHYTLYDQWITRSGSSTDSYSRNQPPTMEVYVNDLLAATFTPQPGPDHYFTFEIPYQTTDRVVINPPNSFTFRFDYVNLNDIYCDYVGILKIHDDSFYNVDFELMPPTLDLSRFPLPISQNSSLPETIYFIIPDNFSGSDLAAAATTAAMITKNSVSTITYKLFKEADRLQIPDKANVVIIGTPSKNGFLRDVLYKYTPGTIGLPSTLRGGKIYINSANRLLNDDEGFVQMMQSNRNQRFTYLVVTGNTDQGVEQAARGLSSPPLGQVGSGFVVSSSFKIPEYKLNDVVTFRSLGFTSATFYGLGTASRNIFFYVPRNWKMEDGTAVVLRYRNSDNLDETNSGLVVYVNDQPAGSVRVELKTTGEKEITIPINKADIRPGWLNVLRIEANITSRLVCLYNPRSFFMNVQDTSLLLLPHSIITDPKQLSPIAHPIYYMGTRPDIHVSMPTNPTYDDMNMLLSFASLFSAMRLPTVNFHVSLGLEEDLSEKSNYNILMIGRPSVNPQIARVNKDLPQRFVTGSDTLEQMVGDVAYQIPPGVSIGLIQVINSPLNPEMGLTLISGTTEEGQKYVYDRLTLSPNLAELAGDLIFIGKQTLRAFNTQGIPVALDLASSGVSGTQVALQLVPTEVTTALPEPTKPSKYVSTITAENPVSQMVGRYLLIALIVAGLIVLVIAIVRTARGGRSF